MIGGQHDPYMCGFEMHPMPTMRNQGFVLMSHKHEHKDARAQAGVSGGKVKGGGGSVDRVIGKTDGTTGPAQNRTRVSRADGNAEPLKEVAQRSLLVPPPTLAPFPLDTQAVRKHA